MNGLIFTGYFATLISGWIVILTISLVAVIIIFVLKKLKLLLLQTKNFLLNFGKQKEVKQEIFALQSIKNRWRR